MNTSPATAALTRLTNLEQRNQRLRNAFYARYTNLPRGRKPERGQLVAQLSDEFYLSVVTVERVLLPK